MKKIVSIYSSVKPARVSSQKRMNKSAKRIMSQVKKFAKGIK